jgi:hypothetical protein
MMMGGMGMRGGGGDMALIGLMYIEEVQKEIDMLPDQIEAVSKLSKKLRADAPDFSRFRDASEEERQKLMEEMREAREKLSQMATEQLEELLLPEQLDRLRQISLQQQGPGALTDERVAKKLEISEEQRNEIRAQVMEVARGMGEELRELFRERDREKITEMMQKMREKQFEAAKKVLSDEQRKGFEEMLGEPFDMPEDAMRGGGRRRGGPGGRGGRGGGRRGGNRGDDA